MEVDQDPNWGCSAKEKQGDWEDFRSVLGPIGGICLIQEMKPGLRIRGKAFIDLCNPVLTCKFEPFERKHMEHGWKLSM
jgi:hypothetical protein